MDWIHEHCDRLRCRLQSILDQSAGDARELAGRRGLLVPWSWTCRAIIKTIMKYPSGLTEAVLLAELELLWRTDVKGAFVPGKLRGYLDAQYAPLSDVVQTSVVRHSDQLVTLVEDHSGGFARDRSPACVNMYLHQNFKACLQHVQMSGQDLLASGRRLRLTGCRLLTGATAQFGRSRGSRCSPDATDSTLLLTEYLAFVLDHRRLSDVQLVSSALRPTSATDSFRDDAKDHPFFVMCKVLEIRPLRQHHDRSAGPAQRRRLSVQTVVLECANKPHLETSTKHKRSGSSPREALRERSDGDEGYERRTVVHLHLWDEQTCLASLFSKGDGLIIFWPWLVEGGIDDAPADPSQRASGFSSQAAVGERYLQQTSGWHYEYGSATAFFVIARESRKHIFSVASGTGSASAGDWDREARRDAKASIAQRGNIRVADMPEDENGARDVLQYPHQLAVAELAPNMSNVSLYGQVVSVAVSASRLPTVVSSRRVASSADKSNLSQQQQQQLQVEQSAPSLSGDAARPERVVELKIRDRSGEARVRCYGPDAEMDALRCRPGHFVLACGLRTLARIPPPTGSKTSEKLIISCGEAEQGPGQAFSCTSPLGTRLTGRTGAGTAACRILNASRLQGFLHCPSLSRSSPLLFRVESVSTLACKAVITWARWAYAGDGLWALHRPCSSPLPCHHEVLSASSTSAPTRTTGRKRQRDVPAVGRIGCGDGRHGTVTCPLCKSMVRLARPEEAELGFAPLLLGLDDGSRCIIATCSGDEVATVFGGINAKVYYKMSKTEQKTTVASVVGRDLRFVLGTNGTEYDAEARDEEGGGERNTGDDKCLQSIDSARYRIERIASVNPAADLRELLA